MTNKDSLENRVDNLTRCGILDNANGGIGGQPMITPLDPKAFTKLSRLDNSIRGAARALAASKSSGEWIKAEFELRAWLTRLEEFRGEMGLPTIG